MIPVRHGRRARQLAVAVIATCAVTAAAPATAPAAKKANLRGQVVGTPYVADTRTAVPVLLSKESARKAGLKSPVGVMLLPRTASVPTPGGRSKPGNLRLGDRFRAVGSITKEARGAVYARVNAVPETFEVYRRGKTLSTAELEALVKTLQAELDKVKASLTGLTNYTLGELKKLRDELGVAKADISAIKAQLAVLQSALDALRKQLEDLTASLNAQLAALNTTVQGLVTTVNSLVTQVNALVTQVNGLVTQVTGLVTQLTNLSGAVTALQGVLGTLTATQLATALGQVQSMFASLAGADGILGSPDDAINDVIGDLAVLGAQVGTLGTTLQGDLAALEANLEGQIGTVATSLSTLGTQVGDIQSDVDILCGPSSLLNTLC